MTSTVEKELARFVIAAKNVICKSKDEGNFSPVSLFSKGFVNPSLSINISVTEKRRDNEYLLFLNPTTILVKPGFLPDAGFMIAGNTNAWLEVLRGEKSLLSQAINGEIFFSNFRVNFPKLVLLSNIISLCTNVRMKDID